MFCSLCLALVLPVRSSLWWTWCQKRPTAIRVPVQSEGRMSRWLLTPAPWHEHSVVQGFKPFNPTLWWCWCFISLSLSLQVEDDHDDVQRTEMMWDHSLFLMMFSRTLYGWGVLIYRFAKDWELVSVLIRGLKSCSLNHSTVFFYFLFYFLIKINLSTMCPCGLILWLNLKGKESSYWKWTWGLTEPFPPG